MRQRRPSIDARRAEHTATERADPRRIIAVERLPMRERHQKRGNFQQLVTR